MKRFPFLLLSLVFVNAVVFADDKATDPNGVVCGPRCVQFVLGRNGNRTDLIELVREMQWPQLTEGASAASVVEALEKRGIHVKPLQVDPESAIFEWEHPMILHLKPDGEYSLGHFVVWMPESTRYHMVIFDGLAGFRVENRKSLVRKMSGIVLATSPTPISENTRIVYRQMPLWLWGIVVCILLTGCFTLFSRRNTQSKP